MPTRDTFKRLSTKFIEETFADFTQTWDFERLIELPDEQGGYTTNWCKVVAAEGFVSPMDGTQSTKDDQLNTDKMIKFSFKHIDGINESMRILYNAEYYNIRSVTSVVGVDIWIDVLAERSVAT